MSLLKAQNLLYDAIQELDGVKADTALVDPTAQSDRDIATFRQLLMQAEAFAVRKFQQKDDRTNA